MALDDEEWGFCCVCRRLEPVHEDGNLIIHRGHAGFIDERGTCEGSLFPPSEQPGPDVEPFAQKGAKIPRDPPPPDNAPRRNWGLCPLDPMGLPRNATDEEAQDWEGGR